MYTGGWCIRKEGWLSAGPGISSPVGVKAEVEVAAKAVANAPKQMSLMQLLGSASDVETSDVARVGDELHCISRSEFQRLAQCLRDRMLITMFQIGFATGDARLMQRAVNSFQQKRDSPVLIFMSQSV